MTLGTTEAERGFRHLSDEAFVERAYALALRRLPDADGLAHYLSRLRAGESRAAVLKSLHDGAAHEAAMVVAPGAEPPAQSGDLGAVMRLDGEAFVRAAYRYVLKRPADPGGLRAYLGKLGLGEDKLALLRALRQSAEARASDMDHAELDAALRSQPASARARASAAAVRRLVGRWLHR